MGFFCSEGEGEWVSGFGSWVILDFRNGRSDNLLKERQKKKVGLSPLFPFVVSVDLWLLFYGCFSFVTALFLFLLLDFSFLGGFILWVFLSIRDKRWIVLQFS